MIFYSVVWLLKQNKSCILLTTGGTMRVIIRDNEATVSKWVANYIIAKINAFKPTAEKPFVLGLATGSTPIGTYQELVAQHKQGKVSFAHVVTFNMDEYVGLPQSHPESYYSFMWHHLFSHIDIKKENAHILNGNATNLKQECDDYEKCITDHGGVHLFIGGIGVDGHIAFNEPGTSLTSRTHLQALTMGTRLVNSRFFDNDINQVPTHALTVGVGTVCDSHEVLLLILGHNKARALRHTVEGSVNHMWTASALQLHSASIIVADEAACDELKLGTYRYFKEID
jgi:glucosamine-6-phosphate deaminase